MTEHDLQTQIMIALSRKDCIVHRTNSGLYYTKDNRRIKIGVVGQSDLQGHRPDGKCFYIEVKLPKQKPTKKQKDFLNAMQQSGALAGVAHNVDEAFEIVFGE